MKWIMERNYNVIVHTYKTLRINTCASVCMYMYSACALLIVNTLVNTGRYKTRNVEWNGTAEWNMELNAKR